MVFFKRKNVQPVSVEAPELEHQLEEAEKRLETAGREFHKKKSVCGLTAIEELLDGLRSGRLKKEDL